MFINEEGNGPIGNIGSGVMRGMWEMMRIKEMGKLGM